MNRQNKWSQVKRVNSYSKINNQNSLREFNIHSNSIKTKEPYQFTSLTNISNLPQLTSSKRITAYQKQVQDIHRPSELNKVPLKQRQRNIVKFQSKPQLIEPKIKFIWQKQKNRQYSSDAGKNQQKTKDQKSKRPIISLKNIKSVQNLVLSPQSISTTNICQSLGKQDESFKRNLLQIKNTINLKLKDNFEKKNDPIKQTQIKQSQNKSNNSIQKSQKEIQFHNTSIITQSKFQKLNIQQNLKIIKEKCIFNVFNAENKQNKKKVDQSQRAKWQQSSIDQFQTKLYSLMLKAKKNSKSRINLIKMSNFPSLKNIVEDTTQ